jgi:DNA-directed RNA polymerase subunit E'/Rpb7
MDPVYERRELRRNVAVPSRYLQRSIAPSLLGQLKMQVEGKCGMEGYVAKDSITILSHSLGRVNTLEEGVSYRVEFQADVCMPHPGQQFRVPVMFRSKIGVHCELDPMKILLPRDLHLGNADFDAIEENEEIDIEVIGSQFQQQDTYIYVLGTLKRRVLPAPALPAVEMPEGVGVEDGAPAAAGGPPPPSGDGNVKVVSVAPAAAGVQEPAARRRRRLVKPGLNDGVLQINVPGAEGAPEGTN